MSKKEAPKRFKPTFANGGFWEYYKDLERQFENFLDYVPYFEDNENTCSFRLANLLLAIGVHIDSGFKELAQDSEFSKKYPELLRKISKGRVRITDYYDLAAELQLSLKKVTFKRLPALEEIAPFQQYEKVGKKEKTPDWWKAYNGIKQNVRKNLSKATLKNTRDALAAAFLLNVMPDPAVLMLAKFGIARADYLGKSVGVAAIEELGEEPVLAVLENKRKWPLFVETSLFKYSYDQ